MLKLSAETIRAFENSAYARLARDIHSKNSSKYTRLSFDDVKEHISRARVYGLTGKQNITIYVESAIAIENQNIDLSKIEPLMLNDSLSIDHKLASLNILIKVLEAS